MKFLDIREVEVSPFLEKLRLATADFTVANREKTDRGNLNRINDNLKSFKSYQLNFPRNFTINKFYFIKINLCTEEQQRPDHTNKNCAQFEKAWFKMVKSYNKDKYLSTFNYLAPPLRR